MRLSRLVARLVAARREGAHRQVGHKGQTSVAVAKKTGNASTAGNKTGPGKSALGVRGDERDVGNALRTAYKNAVDEEIPAEMLDLLNKLR